VGNKSIFPLTVTKNPPLILPLGLASSQPLLLVVLVVKVAAPVELRSETNSFGNTPLPGVKLRLIGLGVAVNVPAPPPPPVTVNVTGIMVPVPPAGVTITLPLYGVVLPARFAAFAITVIWTKFVLDTVFEGTDTVSQVWSDATENESPVVLEVERKTIVESELPAAAESDSLDGAAVIV
jgi:hypothetical protein